MQVTAGAPLAFLPDFPRGSREKLNMGILALSALLIISREQQLLMSYYIRVSPGVLESKNHKAEVILPFAQYKVASGEPTSADWNNKFHKFMFKNVQFGFETWYWSVNYY